MNTHAILENLKNNPPPSLANLDTSHVDKNKPPFVLVDGSYYLFRCFHGLPPLSNKNGLPTNAIRGVLNALNKTLNTHKPTHMAVAFDTKAPTFRHEMSEIYKANRPPMDEDLRIQIPYIHKLITALSIPLIMLDGYEADDIIGTLAYQACQNGHRVVISTGDKDMAQLVNDCVILEDGFKGVQTDSAGVIEKFGVRPDQIIDYLTLMGDASDGIMGVPKVGAKTAAKLLTDYQNLDAILAHSQTIGGAVGKNLIAHAERIPFDKTLATIVTNLDLPYVFDDLKLYQNKDEGTLFELYHELEFSRELGALEKQRQVKSDSTVPKTHSDNHTTPVETHNEKTPAYHTIQDEATFFALVDKLKTAPYFAIDTETTSLSWQAASLVGISLCVTPFEAYYIPLAHVDDLGVLLDGQLDKSLVLNTLKPILENPAIKKIGQNLKYDSHIFANEGINLVGAPHENWQMDTMLASYVINAAATRHNMDDLAKHYLNVSTTSFESIAGKGVKQLTFDRIDIKTASAYACEDADITYRLFTVFQEKLKDNPVNDALLRRLEIPTAGILMQMERTGILVDGGFLRALSSRFDGQIYTLESQAHTLAGEAFNLASPKQLGEILFGKLGLSGGKKTKTGQYATSEEVLSKLEHPLVDAVLEHRSLSKLKSTYTDALAKAADKDGRVHTSYHQALTSTGRLSSTEPNLQNIPIRTDTGRLIREAFIAPKGRVVMAADYSQIELRLMAHFSGDKSLIEAFHQGIDIHTKTASEILGKSIEEVTPMERRSAKAVNFGLLYGMSQFGLAKQLGIDRMDAKRYIDRYFSSYPTIYDYMERTKTQALEEGFVETLLGRKLYMPEAKSTNRMVKDAALRAAINAPLQGSAADIIKLAMIAVNDVLPKDKAALLLQVHDELVLEVDEAHADEIGLLIKTAMQNVLSHTAKDLGFKATLAVPLVVEVGIGKNWDEAH
ncbi:MAG: DNA polymerase I [Moraxella sp.]|nr:DNA polymerase I [Moraxella sp.]